MLCLCKINHGADLISTRTSLVLNIFDLLCRCALLDLLSRRSYGGLDVLTSDLLSFSSSSRNSAWASNLPRSCNSCSDSFPTATLAIETPYSSSLNFLNPLLASARSTKPSPLVRPLARPIVMGFSMDRPLLDETPLFFDPVHLNMKVCLMKDPVLVSSNTFLQSGLHAASDVATIARPGSMMLQRPVCTACLKKAMSNFRFDSVATRIKAQMELTEPMQSRNPAVSFIPNGMFEFHKMYIGRKA